MTHEMISWEAGRQDTHACAILPGSVASAAAALEVEDELLDVKLPFPEEDREGVELSCRNAPTTPPTTAAKMIRIKTIAKIIQKYRRRRPYIFTSLAFGGCAISSLSTVDVSKWGAV